MTFKHQLINQKPAFISLIVFFVHQIATGNRLIKDLKLLIKKDQHEAEPKTNQCPKQHHQFQYRQHIHYSIVSKKYSSCKACFTARAAAVEESTLQSLSLLILNQQKSLTLV